MASISDDHGNHHSHSNGSLNGNGTQVHPDTNAYVHSQNSVVDTEFLIVGAGPAGASLACFLSSHGLQGIMISSAPGTADTPRAHITNMAARECLRDIGLDDEVEALASTNEKFMNHTRWCYSMAGEEFARIHSWGNDPRRKGEYELASPCKTVDIPQTLLEPILVRYATQHGFTTRFNTTFLSFSTGSDSNSSDSPSSSNIITATVRDDILGMTYHIRTKYLFGADGGRSAIVKQLQLPLTVKPGGGLAINVLVKADLSHLVEHRRGNLHWIMQPDREHPSFGWMALVRMVKPWHEWMFIVLPAPDFDVTHNPSNEEYLKRVREWIGDDTPAEIISVAKWSINEIVAEQYSSSDGFNIFCLGDAVHRHPPFNGLGSNTCIQDAYNLAWKIAYVHRGLAHPSLLETYTVERQPIGKAVITRANNGFREHYRVWEALGTVPASDVHARSKTLSGLTDVTPEGRKRRQAFMQAISNTCHEFHGLGIEMGQSYSGSAAIYEADEPEERHASSNKHLTGRVAEDPVLYYEPSTDPGSRLPHVWLNKSVPGKPVSTLDLAGHGAFALFTGIGGDAWKEAASRVSRILKLPINAYSIGYRQDWEDFYFEWERLRGVSEDGVVLVRPDRFVAWRYSDILEGVDECEQKLGSVMRSILGIE